LEIQFWMLRHELRQHRNEMDPGECDSGADSQSSLETCSRPARCELGLGRFFKRPPGALEIAKPGFGGRSSSRRARQQIYSKIFLQLRDRFRDSWLSYSKLSGRS